MRVAARTLPPPLAEGCARVEAQRAAELARVQQERARREELRGEEVFRVLYGLGGCVVAPGGAWSLALDALHTDPVQEVVASGSLRFFGDDGSVAAGPGQPTPDRWAAEVRGVFDYDGDGRAEVILRPTVWGTDPPENQERWDVYTARGGAVVPYAPAAAAQVTGVEDVDRDGRPDLLDANTFATPGGCGQGSGFLYGPTLVAHSLADGTFARDDAAARAYVGAQCPAPPARLYPGDGPGAFAQTVFNVGCARLWGGLGGGRGAATRGRHAGARERAGGLLRVLPVAGDPRRAAPAVRADVGGRAAAPTDDAPATGAAPPLTPGPARRATPRRRSQGPRRAPHPSMATSTRVGARRATRSFGATPTRKPRLPPLTYTRSASRIERSMYTGIPLRVPSGEVPPTR